MKFKYLFLLNLLVFSLNAQKTTVSIKGNQFYINRKPTYEGRTWNGNKIEGLLMNARLVQGVFDDLNPDKSDEFAYPDTKKWDADRNTNEFVAAMPMWKSHGLLAFTLNMQGGSPYGYGNKKCINPGFNADGSLMQPYMNRLERILKKADELNMVVILGLFYFGQDQHLNDEAAVIKAVDGITDWVLKKGYRNVMIEINNECNHPDYDHAILKPNRVDELIQRVQKKKRKGYSLLVSTSFTGKKVPSANVVKVADFILLHGNGAKNTQDIQTLIDDTKKVEGFRNIPMVNNEDDHFDFDKEVNNMVLSVKNYVSWGYFDFRFKGETDIKEGYQTVPVDWGINSERKKGFFIKLKEITSGEPSNLVLKPKSTEAGKTKYKNGNPLVPYVGMADPHIFVYDGKPYLYSTRDLDSLTKGKFVMPDWHIWSTNDLIHWKHERTILPTETYMGKSTDCWATDMGYRNDKYYFYFSDKNRTTGVMTGDSPTGPFKDALGKPMLNTDLTTTKEYDPTILTDDDAAKSTYICFGHHRDDVDTLGYYIAILNDDMISLAEKPRKIQFVGDTKVLAGNDKPNLHKYKGTYYLSAGAHYATSKNIYGPYTRIGNSGFDKFGLTPQAHGNFFEWNNQWFHTWCKFHLGKEVAYYRESYLTYLHYKKDGSMVSDTVLLSKHFANGVGQYSASWDNIEAEWYMAADKIEKTDNTTGFEIGKCLDGGFLSYPNIRDIKENATMVFKINPHVGGKIEVRSGSPTGQLLGSVDVPLESSKDYFDYKCSLKNSAGTHNLYLVFKGEAGKNLLSLDNFKFE
jgi:hypothetical protein